MPGQQQLSQVAAGFLDSLAPRRLRDRLTELDLAARSLGCSNAVTHMHIDEFRMRVDVITKLRSGLPGVPVAHSLVSSPKDRRCAVRSRKPPVLVAFLALASASAVAAAGIGYALGRRSARRQRPELAGRDAAPMPMVCGLPRQAAEAAIRSVASTPQLDIRHVPEAGFPAGTVVAQIPAAGSPVSRDSQVQLVVSAVLPEPGS